MKDLLTIVIPCKNEKYTIFECLLNLDKQAFICGTQIIIADNSNDEESIELLHRAKQKLSNNLQIKIIKGGYPAKARLEGSKLVKTPYLLFLDADVMLQKRGLLNSVLTHIVSNPQIDLLTTPFTTDKKWNWVFTIFDLFQKLSIKLKSPFAVGGFQLWKAKTYWEIGGYNEDELFAEDYSVSSKVNPKNIHIYKTNSVYTSSRRFENKGVLYMFKLMLLSYINRNNSNFFKQHHNYWV